MTKHGPLAADIFAEKLPNLTALIASGEPFYPSDINPREYGHNANVMYAGLDLLVDAGKLSKIRSGRSYQYQLKTGHRGLVHSQRLANYDPPTATPWINPWMRYSR